MAKEKVEQENLSKAEKIALMKKECDKQFGKGSVMGAKDKPSTHSVISTGSLGLDKALGIGGLPKGRIVEIYGPESSGKTTVCLETIAAAHKADPDSYCGFVDMEHAIDTAYAASLGVDLDRLQISQPDYGEQALEIADKMIATGAFDIVVIDSVAALVPKAEMDGEMGDNKMGLHSRLMSQAMRKMTSTVAKTNTICIFINQIREKIGVMFGNPETTTGGNALKFYASIRMDIRRSVTAQNSIMNGEEKIGNLVTVKVIKNKLAPPFRNCEFDVLYGEGIDSYGETIAMGVETGVIEKSGTYFSYNGTSIGQGKVAAVQMLKDNPEMYEDIRRQIRHSFLPTETSLQVTELKETA